MKAHEARGAVSAEEEEKYKIQLMDLVQGELLPVTKSKAEKEKMHCRNCWL